MIRGGGFGAFAINDLILLRFVGTTVTFGLFRNAGNEQPPFRFLNSPTNVNYRRNIGIVSNANIPIPTLGLADEFLGIDITAPLNIGTFGTDSTQTAIVLAAPQLTVVQQPVPVPEPATLLLFSAGLGVVARWRYSRFRRRGLTATLLG